MNSDVSFGRDRGNRAEKRLGVQASSMLLLRFFSFVVFSSHAIVCQGKVELSGKNCPSMDRSGSVVQSPGYSGGLYPSSTNCTYAIQVAEGKRVSLQVTEFNVLGEMPNCTEDYLEVIVG